MSSWIGTGAGSCTRLITPVSQTFSKSPAAVPSKASSRLSARSWRTMRPRSAPIASRMASSLRRLEARASSRLETLAHAISSTNPTTIINMTKK